jgi:hypothetical protein
MGLTSNVADLVKLGDYTTTSVDVTGLDYSTTYYWGVDATDGELETGSPIWSFTTQDPPLPNLTYDFPSSFVNYDQATHVLDGTIFVTNSGTTALNTSINYYLSTNNIITTLDLLLITGSTFSVPASGSASRNFSVDLDDFAPPSGTYYFGTIVDPNNLIAESDETDNFLIRTASFVYLIAIRGEPRGTREGVALPLRIQGQDAVVMRTEGAEQE